MPTDASNSATAAKNPISHVVKRNCDVWELTSSAIVATLKTGIVESTSRIAARAAGATVAGGTLVRSTSDTC